MRIHRYIYALLAIIALASCSSDEQLSKVDVIGNDNPMRFGVANALEESTVTRASLNAGFKVSTYKSFGIEAKQQVVMGGYEVEYTSTDAKKWNYVGVNGQIERYWDADGYPYDFRACTPFIAGASLTDAGIEIDMTASGAPTFKAQTFLEGTDGNGAYNQTEAKSEACMISHVQRKAPTTDAPNDYCDYDLLKPVDALSYTEINTAAKTPVRDVHLPFHHLMSKVGFRFYIDDPSVPTYDIKMKNVTISIVTQTGSEFILESKKYTSTNNSNLLNGTFDVLTRATLTEQSLLTKTDAYTEDIGKHLNHDTAFDFKCPGDMVQIPQKNLKIHVKLTLDYKETSKDFDRYLSIDDTNIEGDLFTWEPNTHYIYYLHLLNLEKYPIITCTAEIVPWEVVKTEDIEIGL